MLWFLVLSKKLAVPFVAKLSTEPLATAAIVFERLAAFITATLLTFLLPLLEWGFR